MKNALCWLMILSLFTYAVQEDGTLLLEDAEIFERQTLEQVLKKKGGAD